MSRYLPLVCLALMHALVDTCSLLVAPLWPTLQTTFMLGVAGLSAAFIVQSLPTSLSQAVFGYLRDRRATPYWIWLGPLIAAVFLTLIGLAPNQAALFLLLLIGGIGIGAFHPEAAVAAGRMVPGQRARGLSLFMLGGTLGLALGPTLSGTTVQHLGLAGLVWLLPPMLVLIALLWWLGGLGRVSDRPNPQAAPRTGQMLEGRGLLALLILLVCSLRLVPNMAMDKVLAFTMQGRGYGTAEIGHAQTLFLASASAGMFLLAWRFRAEWERAFMIGCPLAGIPLLLVLGWEGCPPGLLLALLVPAGIVLWGTTPVMVSYAQQQFPNRAGIASAITMGVAWGLGGLIQAPITAWFQSAGAPQQALFAFTPCLLLSALGAWFLPVTRTAAVPAATTEPAVAYSTSE